MERVILISAWSRLTPDGNLSPKNYPYWREVVEQLRLKGIKTVQVACKGEERVGADETYFDLPLAELKERLLASSGFVAVDNFFPHFASYHKKKGVVIFAKSDPKIFGHPENINLLKDLKYLRKDQFDFWNGVKYEKESFISPNRVVEAVLKIV